MGRKITPSVVDNVLLVPRGGTGKSILNDNSVIIGNGADAVEFVAPGTSGNVLTSNGTSWISGLAKSNSTNFGDIGTYVFASFNSSAYGSYTTTGQVYDPYNSPLGVVITADKVTLGWNLTPVSLRIGGTANISGFLIADRDTSIRLSGSWRCMGAVPISGGVSLWVRVV